MGRTIVLSASCVFLFSLFVYLAAGQPLKNKIYPSPISETQRQLDSIHTDFPDYMWPTDAGRIITSVFAEYRSTHFHGGIDISTGDDTGYKVFAAREGYVARIIVGPSGYGKMLWLRHGDGFYTTYAHLRNFNDAIDAFVRREQLRLERYPVSIACKPTDFPVKKGDIIAYTGETGSGSPHLHFEIRDQNKNFVNPLLGRQFTFQDDSLPRFYSVAATPIGEFSLVNNSVRSQIVEFKNPLGGSIKMSQPFYASGTFGFAVDVRDRINGSRFKSGVYRHELFLDDSLIYAVQLDRAPSGDDFPIGLYYDFDLMRDEGGKIAQLYTNSPNRLPFTHPQKSDAGIIYTAEFSTGLHNFKIISSDIAGNSSHVSGSVVFSHLSDFNFVVSDSSLTRLLEKGTAKYQPRLFGKRLSQSNWKELNHQVEQSSAPYAKLFEQYDVVKIENTNSHGSTSLPHFFFPNAAKLPGASVELTYEVERDFVRIYLRTNGAFTSVPSITVVEGIPSRKTRPISLDYNAYTATFRPLESFTGKRTIFAECEVNGKLRTVNATLTLYPILPNKPSRISFDDGKLKVIADSFSVYKPIFLEIQKQSGDGRSRYSLLPRSSIVDRGIDVKVFSGANEQGRALFFRRANSRWGLLSTKREGEYFTAKLEQTLGELALMTDTKPPSVSKFSTPRSSRQQAISFTVRDNLSGVEYNELKLYIDDVFAIPEIDGEHHRVLHRPTEPLKRGSHTLRILLKDRIGNANEVLRTFIVR